MAKRMTDTGIWKSQRWFRKLTPLDKLVFFYIKDQSDHAGIWHIDCSDLLEDLGMEEFDIKKFITNVNTEYDKMSGSKTKKDRLVVVKQNFLWITGFIQFQYENKEGKVSPEAAPVKTAFQILQKHGILKQAFDKGYITLIQPLLIPPVRAKDKDIDKDKDIHNTKRVSSAKNSLNKTRRTKKSQPIKPFNTMPTVEDFSTLPAQYITSGIELVKTLSGVNIKKETVIALWDVFKIQNLTGQNYYPNEGRVYSHFINVIKKEKFTNGTGDKKHGVAGSVEDLLSKPKW